MRVACPHCPARYNVDDRRVPPGGLNVKCPKCKGVFPVRPPPPADAPAAVTAAAREEPAQAAPAAAAVPEPRYEEPPHVEPERASPPQPDAFADLDAGPALPSAGAPPAPTFDPAFAAFDPSPAPAELVANDGSLSWTAPDEPFAGPPQPFALAPAPSPPPTPSFDDPFSDPALSLDTDQPTAPAPPAPEPPPASDTPALGPLGAAESQELEALFGGGAPERTEILAAPRAAAPADAPPKRPVPTMSRAPAASEPPPPRERERDAAAASAQRSIRDRFMGMFRRGRDAAAEPATTERARRPGAAVRSASRPSAAKEATPAVNGPDPRAPAGARLRRAAPAIAAAALVLAIAGVGVAAGFTRYGFFFHRALTGKLGPNRPGAALLREARARLEQGTFPATSGALRLADQALQLDPADLEAEAVFVQAAARLERDHGGGSSAFARAPQMLAQLAKETPDDVEALRARVAAALAPGAPVPLDSEAALEKHVAAAPGDAASIALLAEAAASKRDVPRATALFEKAAALEPRSGRAPHGIGLLLAATGDREGAARRFAEALARDPSHLSSAVELADLAIAAGEADRARSLLDGALADGARANLGPRERARARTLRATVLARATGDDPGGALDAARRELDAALADDPGYALPRVTLARLLLRRGDPAAALTALGPAAPQAPDIRALALAADGKLLDATNAVDAALAAHPADARLLHVKGVVAAAAHKGADAEKAWADAIARDPTCTEPRVALARARLAAGDAPAALAAANAALERAPGDADVQAVLGDVSLARGDVAAARASFERALRLDPTLAAAHLGLGRVALAARDDTAAESHLRRALALSPRLLEAHRMLGELQWRRGDLAGAREALAAAAALDPRNAVARARLGAVELERGNVDAALSELLAATNADEKDPVARLWYGRALLAKGEVGAAVEQLGKAVELAPESPEAHLWLGAAHERAGNAAEAVAEYRAAIAKSPKLLDPRERLAALLGLQGRWADASAELERAIATAPSEPRLRIALGDARMQMGRSPEAVRIYRAVLEAYPKQVTLPYKIARALHESTGMRAALPWYEKAARLDPSNGMAHYYLGFAYKDLHQRARAVAEFRDYLARRPDAEDRKDIEREIEDLRAGER